MAKASKIVSILLVLGILFNIHCLITLIIFERDFNITNNGVTQQQKNTAYLLLSEKIEDLNKSKKEIRQIISKDIKSRFYIYDEKKMKDMAGKTFPTIRLIVLEPNVSGLEYVVVFTHELMHLKYLCGDEAFVCFETFKYLYESEEFHSAGIWYGQEQLQGHYYGNYNISNLIIDYLTKN